MLSAAASQNFFSPNHPALRLPLYDDAQARSLHRTAVISVGFGAFAYFTCALLGTLGILGEVHQLFLILVGMITSALLAATMLLGREAIRTDLTSGADLRSARGSSNQQRNEIAGAAAARVVDASDPVAGSS